LREKIGQSLSPQFLLLISIFERSLPRCDLSSTIHRLLRFVLFRNFSGRFPFSGFFLSALLAGSDVSLFTCVTLSMTVIACSLLLLQYVGFLSYSFSIRGSAHGRRTSQPCLCLAPFQPECDVTVSRNYFVSAWIRGVNGCSYRRALCLWVVATQSAHSPLSPRSFFSTSNGDGSLVIVSLLRAFPIVLQSCVRNVAFWAVPP